MAKHPGGRPLKFKTPEKLQEAIDDYFEYCDNRVREIWSEKDGNKVVPDPEPYTMAGLAYHIGLSRKSLINYKRRDRFLHTVKKARERVEADIERRMVDKRTFTPGLIFNAKNNFGWRDKVETDITSGGDKLENLVIVKDEGKSK